MEGLTAPITSQRTETKQVADQVQARLNAVNDLEKAVESLTKTVSEKNEEIGKLKTQVKALERLADQEARLEDRERELDARCSELNWKEKELNGRKEIHALEVDMQKTRVADHKEIFDLMLRNTVVRKTGKMPVPVEGGSCNTGSYDSNGNPIIQQNGGYVQESAFEEQKTEE